MAVRIEASEVQSPAGFPSGKLLRATLGIEGRGIEEVRLLLGFLKGALHQATDLELHWAELEKHVPLFDGGEVVGPRTANGPSTITLFTSGTTGVPKRVCRSLGGEIEARRGKGKDDDVWLMAYAPFRWAGISVMLHALANGCALVVPDSNTPEAVCRAMVEGRVSHVSLTPSLLRKMLVFGLETNLGNVPLKQITFGGESADENILATTRRIWPQARISQVYAMTELGDILSVSDGLPGIPAQKIDGNSRFSLSEMGELIVDGHPTGDLWSRIEDRYFFHGRKEEMINVGGAKVSPNQVETAALTVEGVAWARAFPVSSPIVGFTVGLQYLGTSAPEELRKAMRQRLPKVAWPTLVEKVEEMVTTDAMKTSRRVTQ